MTEKLFTTNLRCDACVLSLKPVFDQHPEIRSWRVDLDSPQKYLWVEGSISEADLNELLIPQGYRAQQVDSATEDSTRQLQPVAEVSGATYFPLFLILLYLLLGVLSLEWAAGHFDGMRAMRHFMAGFFLVFSFFKLLNLRGFAEAYQGYDVIAKRIYVYGYAYPFLELALGIAYLAQGDVLLSNGMTLLLMGISTIGVVQSLLQKQTIRCACLGTVFNLPMSKVTLIEDLLMVVMAAVMLLYEVVLRLS